MASSCSVSLGPKGLNGSNLWTSAGPLPANAAQSTLLLHHTVRAKVKPVGPSGGTEWQVDKS